MPTALARTNRPTADLAIVANGDPTSAGTWSRTPRNILDELGRRGLRALPLDATPRHPERLRGYARYRSRLIGSGCSVDGVRDSRGVRRGLLFGRSDYLRQHGVRARAARRVAEAAREAGVEAILHMGNLALPAEAPEAGLRHLILCDFTWHAISRRAEGRLPRSLVSEFERAERQSFEQASHVFPLSAAVADDLHHHYGVPIERITVVGSGRGQFEFATASKDYARPRILFVANARFEEKGGDLLLSAFEIARRGLPDARLTIVGAPRRLHGLRAPGVRALGRVDARELEQLFVEASLFAMPAPLEPWGLVYLEALASGTPVLGLRRNGFPDIADEGRCGFLVDEPDPDPDHVAAALVDALSDPVRLQRMGEAARDHSRRFSWSRVVDRMVPVITAVRQADRAPVGS